MKKKPSPIKKTVVKKPAPKAPAVAQGINDVSPITQKQIARAEQAIDNLREDVKALASRKPKIEVNSPEPKVVVNMPRRPIIAKVVIKYDQLGFPSELIPQYSDSAG